MSHARLLLSLILPVCLAIHAQARADSPLEDWFDPLLEQLDEVFEPANAYHTFTCVEGEHWSLEADSCVHTDLPPWRVQRLEATWRRDYRFLPSGEKKGSPLLVERRVPRRLAAGEAFDLLLLVSNRSREPLRAVGIRDLCGQGLTLLDSIPAVARPETGDLQWRLGDLAPGQTRQVVVRLRLEGGAPEKSCLVASYEPDVCPAPLPGK